MYYKMLLDDQDSETILEFLVSAQDRANQDSDISRRNRVRETVRRFRAQYLEQRK